MMLAQALFQLVAGADAHYPNLSPMHGSKIQLLSKILSLRFSVLRRIVPLLCFQTAKLWRSLMFQSHRCMHGYYADPDVPNPDALLRTLPDVFSTLSSTGLHALCHTKRQIRRVAVPLYRCWGFVTNYKTSQITKQIEYTIFVGGLFVLIFQAMQKWPPRPQIDFPRSSIDSPRFDF